MGDLWGVPVGPLCSSPDSPFSAGAASVSQMPGPFHGGCCCEVCCRYCRASDVYSRSHCCQVAKGACCTWVTEIAGGAADALGKWAAASGKLVLDSQGAHKLTEKVTPADCSLHCWGALPIASPEMAFVSLRSQSGWHSCSLAMTAECMQQAALMATQHFTRHQAHQASGLPACPCPFWWDLPGASSSNDTSRPSEWGVRGVHCPFRPSVPCDRGWKGLASISISEALTAGGPSLPLSSSGGALWAAMPLLRRPSSTSAVAKKFT